MNTLLNRIFQHPLRSALKLAWVTAVLAGCGGGGGSSSTTSFAYGPISGFGSIIVNGVRFDDSSSSVRSEDDDDNPGRHRSDLRLGMVVAIQGGPITSDGTGHRSRAGEIRFGSELVGPVVGTPDVANKRFTLLGQTVQVGDKTIFDNSSNPALASINDISAGNVLEVHGVFNATSNAYDATRIERKSGATLFKIRGAVAALTASTFRIGNELISYPAGLKLPNPFAEGQIVRVKLLPTKDATTGAWVATRIKSGLSSMGDHGEAEVKGTVTAFNSRSDFTVSGISVDASNAAIYPASLGKDAFVEVEGTMVNNKLVARKVTLQDSLSSGSGAFEFHGRVTGLNTERTSFTVHGTTLAINDATAFIRGASRSTLANDMCVEVRANATMLATEVKPDNDCAP